MFCWYLYLTHNYFTSTHTLPSTVEKISLILLYFFVFYYYNYSSCTPQRKERFFCDCLLSSGVRLRVLWIQQDTVCSIPSLH